MSRHESNRSRYRFRPGLLHPRYWPTWLGLLLLFLITLLPMFVVDALGNALGNYAARRNRKRFRIARTNLGLCFPEKSGDEIENMVFAHFRCQMRSALHYFILWWRPGFITRRYIRTEGFDRIEHIRQQGREVIVLLCHTTGLDFAVSAIGDRYSANGPYKPMRNPVIDWWVAYSRLRFASRHGGTLFTRDDGLRPLIRETRKGKVLIYLADEDLGAESSVFAPFYGVPKSTIAVLGRLAQSCRAEVLPCVSCYDERRRRYIVTMLEPVAGLTGKDDVEDATRMNSAIERSIDVCPIQYLWTFRYFQTRPGGEAPVYE